MFARAGREMHFQASASFPYKLLCLMTDDGSGNAVTFMSLSSVTVKQRHSSPDGRVPLECVESDRAVLGAVALAGVSQC